MKHYTLFLILLLSVFLPSFVQAEPNTKDSQTIASATINSILVTFADRTITRRPLASLTGSYRRAHKYKSSTWSKNIAASLAQDFQLKSLFEWPITELGIQCIVFEIPDNRSIDELLHALVKDERVEAAQRMGMFKMHATVSNRDPYYKLQTNILDLRIEEAHQLTTGENIQIALIDTGVDFQHPDLEGQIVYTDNFTTDISKNFSSDIHGTAVAGIVAARANNGIGIIGIAPDAKVVAIKACWPGQKDTYQATCNSLTIALAINRAIQMDVDILNLSLGGSPDPLVAKLIVKAISKGIIVIAADPGINQSRYRFPASMKNVIATRTMLQQGEKNVIQAQSHSISAPGTHILTTIPNATYDFISGCSIAAAHVSGMVALLLEIDPDLTTQEILKLLKTNKKQPSTKNTNGIDILTAISKLRGLSV